MKINPCFEILIAATLGATSGVFVKFLGLPSTTLAFFRFFIPTIIVFLFFKSSYNLTKLSNNRLLFASFLNAFRLLLFYISFIYTSISSAILLVFTWPIFATIFGIIILKEKFNAKILFFILLSFFGVILVYLNQISIIDGEEVLGMAAALSSAILFAFIISVFKQESLNFTKEGQIFYFNVVGAIMFLPFFLNNPFPSLFQTMTASFYAFLVGFVAFMLFFSALKKLPLTQYSLLSYFEVVAAMIFGVFFFNEPIGLNMIIGAFLILYSSFSLTKNF